MNFLHSSFVLTLALTATSPNCAPTESVPGGSPSGVPTAASLGLVVRENGQAHAHYVPWKNEQTLQNQLLRLRNAGGGEIQLMPGQYEISQGFHITNSKDIVVRGTRGVQMVFAQEPEVQPRLTKEVVPGDSSLLVDDGSKFKKGWNYQAYKPDAKGGRVLEFRVTNIEGNRIDIAPKVKFMGHVKEIPVDCIIVEHVNFFTIKRSERISLIGLNMDGIGRGIVRGHTTYCGVLATGLYKVGQRPTTMGLTIENCSFERMMGRGIAVYGMGDVVVEGCYFDDIDSQAIELDHFTTGIIRSNEVRNSGVGVALNDAFDAFVEGNIVSDCRSAISFVKHFDHDWVNTGNRVHGNMIVRPKRPGGVTFGSLMTGNTVTQNTFIDCPEKYRFIRPEGNDTSDNTFIESK